MKPLKGVKVVYMQPKEGALAWICSFAMAAEPKNEDLAYAYLNTAYSSPAMDYLVNAFFTGGSAMTPAMLAKADPKFVKQFHLNSLSRRSSRRRCGSSSTSRTATPTSRRISRSSRPDRRCAGRAARPPAPRLSPWQRTPPHLQQRPRRSGAAARRSRRGCCCCPAWRC